MIMSSSSPPHHNNDSGLPSKSLSAGHMDKVDDDSKKENFQQQQQVSSFPNITSKKNDDVTMIMKKKIPTSTTIAKSTNNNKRQTSASLIPATTKTKTTIVSKVALKKRPPPNQPKNNNEKKKNKKAPLPPNKPSTTTTTTTTTYSERLVSKVENLEYASEFLQKMMKQRKLSQSSTTTPSRNNTKRRAQEGDDDDDDDDVLIRNARNAIIGANKKLKETTPPHPSYLYYTSQSKIDSTPYKIDHHMALVKYGKEEEKKEEVDVPPVAAAPTTRMVKQEEDEAYPTGPVQQHEEYTSIIPYPSSSRDGIGSGGLKLLLKHVNGNAIITNYIRNHDGSKGPAESVSAIRNFGDAIVAVNGISTENMPIEYVKALIKQSEPTGSVALRLRVVGCDDPSAKTIAATTSTSTTMTIPTGNGYAMGIISEYDAGDKEGYYRPPISTDQAAILTGTNSNNEPIPFSQHFFGPSSGTDARLSTGSEEGLLPAKMKDSASTSTGMMTDLPGDHLAPGFSPIRVAYGNQSNPGTVSRDMFFTSSAGCSPAKNNTACTMPPLPLLYNLGSPPAPPMNHKVSTTAQQHHHYNDPFAQDIYRLFHQDEEAQTTMKMPPPPPPPPPSLSSPGDLDNLLQPLQPNLENDIMIHHQLMSSAKNINQNLPASNAMEQMMVPCASSLLHHLEESEESSSLLLSNLVPKQKPSSNNNSKKKNKMKARASPVATTTNAKTKTKKKESKAAKTVITPASATKKRGRGRRPSTAKATTMAKKKKNTPTASKKKSPDAFDQNRKIVATGPVATFVPERRGSLNRRTLNEDQWNSQYDSLVAYHESNGTTKIPSSDEELKSLYKWTCDQKRYLRTKYSLDPTKYANRIEKLDRLGISST